MYKNNAQLKQLKLDDFIFPYGEMDFENKWVTLTVTIPWDEM